MDFSEALDELKALCQWDATPALTVEDLTRILNAAKVLDDDGYAPVDTEYTNTFDMNLAVQRAWQRKAGKAAHMVDFGSDGERFSRSQVIDNCLRMAREYGRRRATGIHAPSATQANGLLPFQYNAPEED
jgi:hypothetical protein